jgi:hypothetical protein
MMSEQRKVIEEIRARKLADLNGDWAQDMAATAPHVAEKMYGEPLQFVRELIQNADDCEYREAKPSLTIRRTAGGFEFQSNETGFQASHVRAVCRFGMSSKGSDRQRFIGEKGLGFKSVFQAADRPEIHSNGYHFRFDLTQHNGLGRAIPEWIEDCIDESGTKIFLPTRAGSAVPQREPDDLEAERWVLLFLRKLDRVDFYDEIQGRRVLLERTRHEREVQLKRTLWTRGQAPQTVTQRFRVVHRDVDVSHAREQDRKNIDFSPVTVAVPIDLRGTPELELQGWEYAFLPVAATDLRFSFNADLLLATDRSAVRETPWNATLCGGLGKCLADAVMTFCDGAAIGVRALGWLRSPARLRRPFHATILESASAALKDQPCIPTATGRWVLPRKAVRPDHLGLHELIDPLHLARVAEVELAADAIKLVRDEAAALGVRELSLADFMHCLRDAEWVKSRPDDWFARLYATLGRARLDRLQIEALRRMCILRMADGSTKALEGKRVFRSHQSAHRYGFERELPLLAQEVCGDNSNSFLDMLGIVRLTAQTVIDEFLLPKHSTRSGTQLDDTQLISHACYIIDHLEEYERTSKDRTPLKPIYAGLCVLTRAESGPMRVSLKASRLYLGAAYKDPHDLEAIWGTRMPERFVSPRYLQSDAPTGKKRDWVAFWAKLRASFLPGMNPSGRGEPLGVAWREESKELFASEDDERIWRFLEIISKHWSHYLEPITNYGLALNETDLVRDLRAIRVQTTRGRVRLDQCMLADADNEAVFGKDQPYLGGLAAMRVFASTQFAEVCGVVARPTIDLALGRLRAVARTGASDDAVLAQVKRLYEYLSARHSNWSKEVEWALQNEPLILIRGENGGWFRLADVCWSWGEGIGLGAYCPLRQLRPSWPQFHDFFVHQLKVPETLTPDAWVRVLRNVAASNERFGSAKNLARQAYLALSAALSSGRLEAQVKTAIDAMRAAPLILCKDAVWRRSGQSDVDLVFGDDEQLEAAFERHPRFASMALDRSDRKTVQPLLTALGIGELRSSVKVEVPEGFTMRAPAQVAERLRERVLPIARLLYQDHPRNYEEAISSGLFDFLADAIVSRTQVFRVTLRRSSVECTFVAKLLGTGRALHLHVNTGDYTKSTWREVGITIADELRLSGSVGASLGDILNAETQAAVDCELQSQRVPDLPPEELDRLPMSGRATVTHASPTSEREPEPTAASRDERFAPVSSVDRRLAEHHDARNGVEAADSTAAFGEAADEPPRDEEIVHDDEDRVASGGDSARAVAERNHSSEFGGGRSGRRIVSRGRQSFGARAMLASTPVEEVLIAEIEAAAIAFVLAEERRAGREPIDRNTPDNPDNPGYDIESWDPRTKTTRYIEVKGTKNEWGEFGVAVSPTQVRFALERGEAAWLYVVECALHEERKRCYRIQNFASKIEEFVVDGRLRRAAER